MWIGRRGAAACPGRAPGVLLLIPIHPPATGVAADTPPTTCALLLLAGQVLAALDALIAGCPTTACSSSCCCSNPTFRESGPARPPSRPPPRQAPPGASAVRSNCSVGRPSPLACQRCSGVDVLGDVQLQPEIRFYILCRLRLFSLQKLLHPFTSYLVQPFFSSSRCPIIYLLFAPFSLFFLPICLISELFSCAILCGSFPLLPSGLSTCCCRRPAVRWRRSLTAAASVSGAHTAGAQTAPAPSTRPWTSWTRGSHGAPRAAAARGPAAGRARRRVAIMSLGVWCLWCSAVARCRAVGPRTPQRCSLAVAP